MKRKSFALLLSMILAMTSVSSTSWLVSAEDWQSEEVQAEFISEEQVGAEDNYEAEETVVESPGEVFESDEVVTEFAEEDTVADTDEASQITMLSVELQNSEYIVGIDYFQLKGKYTISYADGTTDTIAISEWNSITDDNRGNSILAAAIDEDSDWINYPAVGYGKAFPELKSYPLVFKTSQDSKEIQTDRKYSVSSVNVKESSKYQGAINLGENEVKSIESQYSYYSFIPEKSGDYRLVNATSVSVIKETASGNELVHSTGSSLHSVSYSLTEGDTYYFGFTGNGSGNDSCKFTLITDYPVIDSLAVQLYRADYVSEFPLEGNGKIKVGYSNGDNGELGFSFGYSGVEDNYGNFINISLRDSEGNQIWQNQLSCGTYTVQAECGELKTSANFDVVELEKSSQNKGTLSLGKSTVENHKDYASYYTFVPQETAKYKLQKGFVNKIWQKTEEGYQQILQESITNGMQLEANKIYCFSFCGGENVYNQELQKWEVIEETSIELCIVRELQGLSVKPLYTTFPAYLPCGNLVNGAEVTFTYSRDVKEEKATAWWNGVSSASNDRASVVISDGEGNTYDGYNPLPEGTYQVKFVCGEVESEPYTLTMVENLEDTEMYRGEMFEGVNKNVEISGYYDTYCMFKPQKGGRYYLNYVTNAYYRTQEGYVQADCEEGGNFFLESGKVYYLSLYRSDGESKTSDLEIKYQKKVTDIQIKSLYLDKEYGRISGKLLVTYEDGNTSECEVRWGTAYGIYDNDIIALITAEDGTEYFYSDRLPEGTYTVQFVCEEGKSAPYKLKISNAETECIHATPESWAVVKAPTCTEEGMETGNCPKCGVTITRTVKALGHSFINYVSDGNATCLNDGTKTAKCSNCAVTNTITDAGSKLTPSMKVTATKLPLKLKQKVTKFAVTNMAKGDFVESWKSSNTKVVKVSGKPDGTCIITAQNKVGTAKITITLKSGLTQNLIVKVQKATVATSKITGITSKVTIEKGKSLQLNPVLSPISSTEKITYVSSDKKVVAVSKKGKITAKGIGTAKITVKSGKKKIACTVTVPGIKNVKSSLRINKGKSVTIKPKKYGISEKITFSSSNTKVATVSSKGKITGKKKGSAVITVRAGSYSVKCKVSVK